MAAYPKVRCASNDAPVLAASITVAGIVIVQPQAGRTLRIVGGWMRSVGNTVGTASTVNFGDTTGTDEVMVGTAANLTNGTILRENSTGMTCTKLNQALPKGAGILFHAVTGTVGTTTSMDYCVYYTVEGG